MNWLFFHRPLYAAVGAVTTKQFDPVQKRCRYGVLIAARNEEAVIAHLCDSIKRQSYDGEVTIFVVADNCTDNTAAAAKSAGAVVYERQDPDHRTKGYALQFLVKCIDRDYGIQSCDGYFVFDADNLLEKDFIARMNEAFAAGNRVVTSYRASKNFDDNAISAMYGLHWLRTVRLEHRARSVFGLSTRIQGTGFLMASDLLKNGWNYTSLTEDRALCADLTAAGERITYCDAAVFYDEQPTDFDTSVRQRLRWAKGHWQAVWETGPKLLKKMLSRPFCKDGFIAFDMLGTVLPMGSIGTVRRILLYIGKLAACVAAGAVLAKYVGVGRALVLWAAKDIAAKALVAAYVMFAERKRLPKIPIYKKVWYCFTFFVFDVLGRWCGLAALFKKVEWTPIKHDCSFGIDRVNKSGGGSL